MEVRYTTKDGRIILTGAPNSFPLAIEMLGQFQELFEETKCGLCGHDAHFGVRFAKDKKYYNKRCQNPDCRAQLDLWPHKDGGTMFVGRTDKEGNMKGTNGWYQWQRQENAPSSQSETPSFYDDKPQAGTVADESLPF